MKVNFNEYRVKTLEEFGGKRPHSWNGAGKMDYLYGMELNNEIARFDSNMSTSIAITDRRAPNGYWLIGNGQIVKNCKIKIEVRG